ncbi:MAG: hypothetical protein SPL73_01730 [Cyanobacteriota bacterium]|nr:hypothetical protein [Cyanobacteriota bacterium]MDY6363594.1 hypothetical protein [Cyanobacteriota bacterium]
MKFIAKLKNKFAFHMFAAFGWIIAYEFFKMSNIDGGGIFIIILISVWLLVLLLLSIVLAIEHIANHDIQIKFFIENKLYNILCFIGFLISSIFTLFSICLIAITILSGFITQIHQPF